MASEVHNRNRSRLTLLGILALALSVTAGLTIGDALAAKKKKKPKAGGTADITKVVGASIPDATATTDGVLTSTIDVAGKKFRDTQIRDVNVTVQTTGNNGDPMNPSASQLAARVTAPNGGTAWLFGGFALFGQSVGPLTFDDESANILALGTNGAPQDSTQLGPPYIGTTQPDPYSSFGPALLAVMDNGPATGTWTLRIYDTVTTGPATSILGSWRLVVVAGKAYKTK